MQLEARAEKALKQLDRAQPKVVYAVEPLLTCLEEVALAAYASYVEIGMDPENIPYSPDWEHAFKFEPTGDILIVTARKRDKLIGYALGLIGPYKHSKDKIYADLDTVWLHPNYRNTDKWIGIRLVKAWEKALLERKDIDFILVASTLRKPIDAFLMRLGYRPVETLFYKNVKADK